MTKDKRKRLEMPKMTIRCVFVFLFQKPNGSVLQRETSNLESSKKCFFFKNSTLKSVIDKHFALFSLKFADSAALKKNCE